MSDVSKTNEALIAEAQEHYSEMNGLNSRAAEVMMELVAALEAKTGVRVDMSSAVGVETQLAATRVPVQGEPNDDREAVARAIAPDDWRLADAPQYAHLPQGARDSLTRQSLEAADRVIASRATVPDAASAAIERVRALLDSPSDERGITWWDWIEGGLGGSLHDDLRAALDGAPEPEWEEVVQYGNLTSAGFLQEIRGRNYAMHKRVVRFGPVLPVDGESK